MQLSFHQSAAYLRALLGGNQSGKTYCGCADIAYTIGKVHPYRPNYIGPVFARDCCVSFGAIKSILIPTYKRLLPRKSCNLGWQTFEGKPAVWPGLRGGAWDKAFSAQDMVLHLEDGSFIEFKSYEQGREAMQGAQRHIIRHDEEPPEDIFEENLARQITLQANILFTLTPLNYSQWLYARIYERAVQDGKTACFFMDSYSNPYANPEVLETLEENCLDPAIRAARIHGHFTFLSGRVYKEYGEHNLCDPFPIPRSWRLVLCIDPHLDKATGVNIAAESPDGKLYIIAEGDFEGDVEEVAQQIIVLCCGRHIDTWLIDPSARAAAKIHGKGRLIDAFREFFPRLLEADNDRESGWNAVRRIVKNDPVTGPKLKVFRTCPITHHQMKNYMWKRPPASGEDRRKPEVHKKNDEHPDNIRYITKAMAPVIGEQFEGWSVGGL